MNLRLKQLYSPLGGNVRALLHMIDLLFDNLLLSLNIAKKEFKNVLFF